MMDTIARLEAIYYTAKDIHYTAKGEPFYGIHILMDKITDGIQEQIDDLKETYFLNKGTIPTNAEILQMALRLMPEITDDTIENIRSLSDLMGGLDENLGEMDGFTCGVRSLLDDIARSIEKKKGLLQRVLA